MNHNNFDPLTPEEAKGYIGCKVRWESTPQNNSHLIPKIVILVKVFDLVEPETESDKFRFLVKVESVEGDGFSFFVERISLIYQKCDISNDSQRSYLRNSYGTFDQQHYSIWNNRNRFIYLQLKIYV